LLEQTQQNNEEITLMPTIQKRNSSTNRLILKCVQTWLFTDVLLVGKLLKISKKF